MDRAGGSSKQVFEWSEGFLDAKLAAEWYSCLPYVVGGSDKTAIKSAQNTK